MLKQLYSTLEIGIPTGSLICNLYLGQMVKILKYVKGIKLGNDKLNCHPTILSKIVLK